MRFIVVILALATVCLAKVDAQGVAAEPLTWTLPRNGSSFHTISCTILNNMGYLITNSFLRFDLYAEDGTKIGERLALMESVPAGQRVSYSTDFMPESTSLPRPVAYVKFGSLEGRIEGQWIKFHLGPNLQEVWNPYIVAARLSAEAKAKKQAEKERIKAEKERKKAEKEAQKSNHSSPAN
jgi:hypothetical protein